MVRILSFFESAGEQANLLTAKSLEAAGLFELGSLSGAIKLLESILQEACGISDSNLIHSTQLSLLEAYIKSHDNLQASRYLQELCQEDFGESKRVKDRLKRAEQKLREIDSDLTI